MKKQMMAVLAFSAMMTLTMPFASFAAGRSCQTAFPSGSTCASNGNYAVSVIRMQNSCAISNLRAADVYRILGASCTDQTCGITCSSGIGCDTGCNTGCRTNFCGNLSFRR